MRLPVEERLLLLVEREAVPAARRRDGRLVWRTGIVAGPKTRISVLWPPAVRPQTINTAKNAMIRLAAANPKLNLPLLQTFFRPYGSAGRPCTPSRNQSQLSANCAFDLIQIVLCERIDPISYPHLAHGHELVRHGFAVLAPE